MWCNDSQREEISKSHEIKLESGEIVMEEGAGGYKYPCLIGRDEMI